MRFGTDGWRAVIADEFTYSNLRIVTRAVAEYLLAKNSRPLVIIGYDRRFMGSDFAAAAAEVLVAAGIDVMAGTDSFPTPVIAQAVVDNKADGAIMLTASHNPYYYNGFKFIPDYAGPATTEITGQIEANISAIQARGESGQTFVEAKKGKLNFTDFGAAYEPTALRYVDTERIAAAGLNAAIDPFYGAATVLMPRLAKAAGLNTTVIRDEPDPFFGGLLPDPSESNLKPLRELVLKKKLDVGLALDGDADRFGVIADDGSYLTPNQVIALLLKHMVMNRGAKGAVARTVATTRLIDKMAVSYGVDVVETPVGFKYVGQVMRERDVIIGGEESGGLSVLGHIPEKDGLLANLLIAEMIAFEGKPLSRIWDGIRQEFGEVHNTRLDIHYPLDKKDALLSGLRDAPPREFGGQEVTAVRTVEGVGLDLAEGAWMLVRPSGTEPLVRVYMEAESLAALDAMKKAAEKMLES